MHLRGVFSTFPSRSLRRFFSNSYDGVGGGRMGLLREELQGLESFQNTPAISPAPPKQQSAATEGVGRRREVEITHPWPEWMRLMELLLVKGYVEPTALVASRDHSSSTTGAAALNKESNHIRTACLNFARDRPDIIRIPTPCVPASNGKKMIHCWKRKKYMSRGDIQLIVKFGCPSIDRKVVNSGKRLRAHVGIQEGDVCSSCSLRGSCERAYVKAREEEVGRTVDVMRILLTYGLDIIIGSVENQACVSKTAKVSVKKLLSEMVEFGAQELDSNAPSFTSARSSFYKQNKSSHHKGQSAVPMKQGDWICPKCNFLNFSKNIKCLRCNGESQERLKKLHDEQENLPLKKGDWLCEKCNFLNFAKNTKCLQCRQKPSKRLLNPGEWECVSCNYINFRKNMVCLKCDWRRPKSTNNGEFAGQTYGKQEYHKGQSILFVRDGDENKQKLEMRDYSDSWSSTEDWDENENCNKDSLNMWKNSSEFINFPIIGGKSQVSQDVQARERWRHEMLKRSKGLLGERARGPNARLESMNAKGRMELDDSSTDDEMAEWFGHGRTKDGLNSVS